MTEGTKPWHPAMPTIATMEQGEKSVLGMEEEVRGQEICVLFLTLHLAYAHPGLRQQLLTVNFTTCRRRRIESTLKSPEVAMPGTGPGSPSVIGGLDTPLSHPRPTL